MYYSKALEALFLFIHLLLAGSVVFGAYPSKTTIEEKLKGSTELGNLRKTLFLVLTYQIRCDRILSES